MDLKFVSVQGVRFPLFPVPTSDAEDFLVREGLFKALTNGPFCTCMMCMCVFGARACTGIMICEWDCRRSVRETLGSIRRRFKSRYGVVLGVGAGAGHDLISILIDVVLQERH